MDPESDVETGRWRPARFSFRIGGLSLMLDRVRLGHLPVVQKFIAWTAARAWCRPPDWKRSMDDAFVVWLLAWPSHRGLRLAEVRREMDLAEEPGVNARQLLDAIEGRS